MTKISLDLSVLSDRDILNEVESRGLSSNNVGSNDEKIKRFKKFNDILRELVSAFYKDNKPVKVDIVKGDITYTIRLNTSKDYHNKGINSFRVDVSLEKINVIEKSDIFDMLNWGGFCCDSECDAPRSVDIIGNRKLGLTKIKEYKDLTESVKKFNKSVKELAKKYKIKNGEYSV